MTDIYQVLWSLAVHTTEHHDAQLVGDLLGYIEPVQLQPLQKTTHTSGRRYCNHITAEMK